MRRTTDQITTEHCLEELGRLERGGIEFDVKWDIQLAEPMVQYYADGSGYPGSDACAEPIGVKVTAAWNDDWFVIRRHPKYAHETSRLNRDADGRRIISRPDWLDALTDYVENRVHTDLLDEYTEEVFQADADREDDWQAGAVDAADRDDS